MTRKEKSALPLVTRETVVALILAEIDRRESEYTCYGLRIVGDKDPIRVGAAVKHSHRWLDGIKTKTWLCGTSAIELPWWSDCDAESITEAVESLWGYVGDRIVLLGSNRANSHDAEDPDEVMMQNPTALAMWRREDA